MQAYSEDQNTKSFINWINGLTPAKNKCLCNFYLFVSEICSLTNFFSYDVHERFKNHTMIM